MTASETTEEPAAAVDAQPGRRRWLPQWRPRNVVRLFNRAVASFRPGPPLDAGMMHRLVRAERRGLQLAILCRTVAFSAAGVFYVVSLLLSNSRPTAEGLAVLCVLIGLGVAHFIIIGTRHDRTWLKYLTTTADLLAVAGLVAFFPPSSAGDLPQIYAFRDWGIYPMFPLVTLAALSFSPQLVIWAGAVGVAGWWAAFLWIVSGMEETVSWSDVPQGASRADYEAVVFSPNFIGVGDRMVESLTLIIMTLILAVVVARARRLFFGQVRAEAAREAEREQRAKITAQLGRYVPAAIARRLVENPSGLAPRVRHGAALMLDVRDFTAFAEGRDPAEVIAELNTFLARCAEVVSRHEGVVITFMGDGLLATFGTPLDLAAPERAALAAAEGLVACGRERGFVVRVGVASGPIAAGSVGSTERQAFTVYGDTVNRAARLEALGKELGAAILVDGATAATAPMPLVPCGAHELRGFREPVPVFALDPAGSPVR